MATKRKNAQDRLDEGLARMGAKYGRNWHRGMLTSEEDKMMNSLFQDNLKRLKRATARDRAKAARVKFYAYTPKEVDAIKKKLSATIREVTAVMERNDLKDPYRSLITKLRKRLMDTNEYLGWSVAQRAQDKPKGKYL